MYVYHSPENISPPIQMQIHITYPCATTTTLYMHTFSSRSHFVTKYVLNNIHLPQLELNILNEHQHWALDASMVMLTTYICMFILCWWCNMDIDTRSFNYTTYIFHYIAIAIERTRKRTHLLLLLMLMRAFIYTLVLLHRPVYFGIGVFSLINIFPFSSHFLSLFHTTPSPLPTHCPDSLTFPPAFSSPFYPEWDCME